MIQPWFKEAKLGIFLHWGIYAVEGTIESWPFYNEELSYEQYMKQADKFTADRYDPKAWAKLFKRAGARYAVMTSKHHDGFALFDTKWSELNAVKMSPAGRDLVGPYCDALRDEDLKVGIYFSHLDWSHPDYASVTQRESNGHPDLSNNRYGFSQKSDFEAWERYIQFHRGQLKELSMNYGPIDLLWFDGDWDRGDEYWRMKQLSDELHSYNPNIVLNERMKGHGDFMTPEQGVPIIAPEGPWEFCMTINDSWGHRESDTNFKSVRQIIRTFAECIGMGGNLLLGFGPRADGSIDERHERVLLELGEWISKHEEAVYSTTRGLPPGHVYGATTLSEDHCVLYVFLFDRPWDSVPVKGIINEVKEVSVLGTGNRLKHRMNGGAPWANVPGTLWFDLPEQELDPNATVVMIELDGPLRLYRGGGHAIAAN